MFRNVASKETPRGAYQRSRARSVAPVRSRFLVFVVTSIHGRIFQFRATYTRARGRVRVTRKLVRVRVQLRDP